MFLFGDTDLTYHFGKNFFSYNNIFLWNDYFKAGIFDFDKFQGFYLKKIIFFFNSVFDLYYFGYLWYFIPMLLYVTTSYLFIREVIEFYEQKTSFITLNALVLSIFSISNGIFFIYYGQVLVILSLTMLNLFLLFFIKNIVYIKLFLKNNYTYLALCGLFLSQTNIYLHTSFLLIYAALTIITLNYKFILKYKNLFFIQAIVLLMIVISLNAQWLLPIFFQYFESASSVKNLVIYDAQLGWDQAKNISKNIFMFDLLKLKSYYIFNNYPSFFNFFYFIPLGIVLYYFSRRKNKQEKTFIFGVVFIVISLFFAFGIQPISEIPYRFLWDNLPFFSSFRTIFKFSFLYLYALIFVLAYILSKYKKSKEYFTLLLLLFMSNIFSIYYYYQPEVRSNLRQYTIPNYYFDLEAENLSENTKKIGNLITSPQFNWQFQYQWAPEKVDGMNILPYFYGRGVFINGAQDTPDIQYIFNDYFDYQLRNNNLEILKNIIGLRNIKYISFQDDLRITNDESTPYIVKSNLEISPNADKVFSNKFIDEICADVKKFDKLFFCQIKNSLFTPLIKIKNEDVILIRNENFLNYLGEADYFVPYSRRLEKNFSKINLVEESPIIINDLIDLGITNYNDVRIIEDSKDLLSDSRNKVEERIVYPSMKPFQVKNCFFQLECSIFTFQNVETARYKVYFVRYSDPNKTFKEQQYSVKVIDDVDDSFIMDNILNLKNRKPVKDYENSDKVQQLSFIAKKSAFVGEINVTGKNTIIRMIGDASFADSRFYLVKEADDRKITSNLSPTLEFKKINPSKLRIRVHGAKNTFPLVLANNFDRNWTLFLSKLSSDKIDNKDFLQRYKVSSSNELDQVTSTELAQLIEDGLVTDINPSDSHIALDDKNDIAAFISKNIKGSIQNDNLPNGSLWETWFQDSLNDNSNHFIDDGYSNGWFINPKEVCKYNNDKCIQNSNGTYDIEFVIEFRSQKLLYLGLVISVITFFGCILFVIYTLYSSNVNNIRI